MTLFGREIQPLSQINRELIQFLLQPVNAFSFGSGPKAQTLTCKARSLQGNLSGVSLIPLISNLRNSPGNPLCRWWPGLLSLAPLPAHAASPQAGPGLYLGDLWISPGQGKSTGSLGNLCQCWAKKSLCLERAFSVSVSYPFCLWLLEEQFSARSFFRYGFTCYQVFVILRDGLAKKF